MILWNVGYIGHREPLLFLLWMTIALPTKEFSAIPINEEISRSERKSSHEKRDDGGVHLSSLHIQGDFPYRFVLPANHPYLFTQHLSPPIAGIAYKNANYDMYSSLQGPTLRQQDPSSQPEFRYVIKPQPAHVTNGVGQSIYPNTYPVTSVPYSPTLAPVILLLQPSPSVIGSNVPFQTFMLIPSAEGAADVNNLIVLTSHSYNGDNNLPTGYHMAALQPYSNLGLHAVPKIISKASPQNQIYRPSHHSKSNNNGLSAGLLQRPINVMYPSVSHKYYPQKKVP